MTLSVPIVEVIAGREPHIVMFDDMLERTAQMSELIRLANTKRV
ncbi:MAG: hypothetical protein AAF384_14735 [Pseudomonadota bacterium]